LSFTRRSLAEAKVHQIIFKNLIPSSKENITLHNYKVNLFMLFKKIIAIYTENHTKPINTRCRVTDC
jgi:hypothetical protein